MLIFLINFTIRRKWFYPKSQSSIGHNYIHTGRPPEPGTLPPTCERAYMYINYLSILYLGEK